MKAIRFSAAAMAAAISGLLLVLAPSANASGPAKICETHGLYCVGAQNLGASDPVQETFDGRVIEVVSVGGNAYRLEINAMPHLCVAASDNGMLAVLKPCGNDGVVWLAAKKPGGDGHSCRFQSRQFPGKFLTGDNQGDQFTLKDGTPPAGSEQQFSTSAQVISGCG
jgi:hypothetical protein